MTQPLKTEMILQMEVTDIFSHLMFPVFSLALHLAVLGVTTGSIRQ